MFDRVDACVNRSYVRLHFTRKSVLYIFSAISGVKVKKFGAESVPVELNRSLQSRFFNMKRSPYSTA
jgi:hypothetical protein